MRLVGRIAAIVTLSLFIAASSGTPSATAADTGPVVVWADPSVAPALRQVLAAVPNGISISVIAKPVTDLAAQLSEATSLDAPDLVWLPNSMIGDLAANGLVDRLPLGPALRDRFPSRLLDGFRYGFAYYGLPIRYSNVALVVNTDLAPVLPTTFAALEKKGLRLVADGQADLPLSLGQGEHPDDAALYPLLSGLGGYLFGRNSAGSLDAYNVGLACPAFLANSDQIDRWNDSGLLSSRTTPAKARRTFLAGRAPFWITDPQSAADLDNAGFGYQVVPVPPLVDGITPAPLLDVEGVAVTTFARDRGTFDAAITIVRKVLARPDAQSALAAAADLAPARPDAPADQRTLDFAAAGAAGTAMPNIVQAGVLWPVLDSAWASATAGETAVRARVAFTSAQRAAIAAVG